MACYMTFTVIFVVISIFVVIVAYTAYPRRYHFSMATRPEHIPNTTSGSTVTSHSRLRYYKHCSTV